jgi:hypothetical protein
VIPIGVKTELANDTNWCHCDKLLPLSLLVPFFYFFKIFGIGGYLGYSVPIAQRGTGVWKHFQDSLLPIWLTDRHLADWQRSLDLFYPRQPQQQRHCLTF